MSDCYNVIYQAILVHIYFSQKKDIENLKEFKTLVSSAGVKTLSVITGSRNRPNSKFFVGEGKAFEIAKHVNEHDANIVLFNHSLSPVQQRNLEAICNCRVIERSELILDIFAQRACSYEGKLQVELAQLRHLATRLVRGWTHLERQKGGIGLRGPGETQLETDRRLLHNRITFIISRIENISKQRKQSRHTRSKSSTPTISMVGYTNAGKSTLFNSLTNANTYVADQLFATLDLTLRHINLTDVGRVVIADTVGFIRDLPHDLVAAFKTTLQETREAALLVHVIDASDTRLDENIIAVNKILKEIQSDKIFTLLVMNKIDMLNDFLPRIDRNENNIPVRVWLSAKNGNGIELLFQALKEILTGKIEEHNLCLPPTAGRLRSYFYQIKAIKKEWIEEDGRVGLKVRIPSMIWQRICKKEPNLLNFII